MDRGLEESPKAKTAGSAAMEATRGGEARTTKWSWVEPSVWTERMLAALETGVKGGRWYSLMDKLDDLWLPRPMDSHAPAQHPAQAAQTQRPRPRRRPSTLAQRLFHRPWAVLADRSPRVGPPIRSSVKPPTGEPDAGDPRVRFGGRGNRLTDSPYPYQICHPCRL